MMERGRFEIESQIQQDRNPSQTTYPTWLSELTSDYSEDCNEGRWYIWRYFQDKEDLDDYDNIWKAIKTLVQQNRIKKAICSTVGHSMFRGQEKGVIICHTSDFKQLEDVREVAKHIVENIGTISLHKHMYYKVLYEDNDPFCLKESKSIFKYTEKHQFFYRDYDDTWTLVTTNQYPWAEQIKTDADHSDDESPWLEITTPGFVCSGDVGYWCIRISFTRITDKQRFLATWEAIAALFKSGSTCIKRAVCSTDASAVAKKLEGIIMCYTSDYTDMNDVRNVAELIKRSISWEDGLYYKPINPILLSSENNEISIYKYKGSTLLYRDPSDLEWTPLVGNRCPYL